MELKGFMGGLYKLCDWIMRLAYVNILWFLFTLVGLVVFGFAPATAALFAVTRKWVMGETDIPVFKTFWNTYRSDFVKINLLGYLLLAIGYVLYIDIVLVKSLQGPISSVILVLLLSISLVYVVAIMYFFPVYAHFKIKTLQYLKYTVLIGISNIFTTIMMLAGTFLVCCIIRFLPGLLPFFSASLLSLVFTWCAHRAFHRLERKKEALGERSQAS